MEPLLVYPEPAPGWLVEILDAASYPWRAVHSASEASRFEPEDGWAGAVVSVDDDVSGSLAECLALCRALRKREEPLQPVLLAVPHDWLGDLDFTEELFDDFVLTDASAKELEARL
ncbi:MAG TPA: hypothetical protein VGP46_03720, partial [Acidimicrobiales bacterium]|nr:hypothetical protein [Acidimicrobiales bacterium]